MSQWPRETFYSEGSVAGLSSHDKVDEPSKPANRDTYRVVFWGQCVRGTHKAQVARAFAKRFNVASTRQLAALFSGKIVTLKRGLSSQGADRYVAAVQSVGGICRKESEYKDYFSETEFKPRNNVSFLDDDFDPTKLSLAPKDEFATEV